MAAPTSGGPVDSADTAGWDTVFAIRIEEVNKAIQRAGSSPAEFAADDAADKYSIAGKFGTWQITTGGSNDTVILSVPFSHAKLTRPDGSTGTFSGTAPVSVKLAYLPTGNDVGEGMTESALKVRLTADGDDPVATVQTPVFPDPQPNFMDGIAVKALLQQWMTAHLDEFDHVFATVMLNRTADKGAFQWLQPTSHAYAYADFIEGGGALGVLCMTEGRSAKGLIPQLSGQAIPKGQSAAFLISGPRMMEKMLLPVMPQLFKNSKEGDFKLSSTGLSIVNANTGVTFETKEKTSHLHDFSLTLDVTQLALVATTKTEASPGIHAWCRSYEWMSVKLVTNSKGEQTLGYEKAKKAHQDHWTVANEGIKITEEILGAIAAILTVIAIIVTDGAALLAVGLIVGLVAGVMQLTTAIIQDVGNDDAPAITPMMLNAIASTTWADGKDFKLTGAGLSGSLQLSGVFEDV